MAISNLTTGLRSGVCTSTTRPSAPYEGQMIYETDTNRVLVWDNAAWVMIADTDTPPGLQFIKSGTASGTSTSLSIDSCFTSEFTNYFIQFNGLGASNDQSLNIRFRANGSDTSTGSVYRHMIYYAYVGQTSVNAAGSNGANEIRIGNISNAETNYHCFISNPQLSKTTILTGEGLNNQAAYSNSLDTYRCHGFVNNTTQYDGFTIFTAAGNLTGTVRVYGYRD